MMLLFKPRRAFTKWLKLGAVLVIFLMMIVGYIGWQFVRPAGRAGENKFFTIKSGEAAKQISNRLADLGLIKSSFWFETWLRISGRETMIKSGYYSLPGNINIINLTYLITGGVDANLEVSVRLLEGWTIKEMADYFDSQNIISGSDFMEAVTSTTSARMIAQQVKGDILNAWPGGTLEGYLFPDTYRIYRDSTAEDIAVKMVNNLNDKFPIDWRNIVKQKGYNVHEVLTLASIVEKEVPSLKDRKMVADIFWKRLEAKIGLQADSTINYLTGKKTPAVSAYDLQIDSPYNTYKYRGLPPGPICNPSQSAIEAVVFPEANDYWYFLTTPDGKVIYSKTFDEHKQARIRYLR